MATWGIRYGRCWAIQWRLDGCLSLGIHLEPRRRPHVLVGSYGPYLDLHLGLITVSIGNRPAYSGDLERALSISRGGLPA